MNAPATNSPAHRHGIPGCLRKPADTPQFNVGPNATHPYLVRFAVGTGQTGYDITPECAEQLADALRDAAATARLNGGAR
jgi:hypothetical protein